MDLMTIGAFAERTRLSPKALRLYDQLGLLPPEQIEPSNAYRLYSEEQVERAQLIGLLRRLEMPLSIITEILSQPTDQWPAAIGGWWGSIETVTAERRDLVSYLQARLRGATVITPDVQMRALPERRLLTISRHLHASETDSFFDYAFARLRNAGKGLEGIAG
jgi:DNA-binding transcriptional MerR regulator